MVAFLLTIIALPITLFIVFLSAHKDELWYNIYDKFKRK